MRSPVAAVLDHCLVKAYRKFGGAQLIAQIATRADAHIVHTKDVL